MEEGARRVHQVVPHLARTALWRVEGGAEGGVDDTEAVGGRQGHGHNELHRFSVHAHQLGSLVQHSDNLYRGRGRLHIGRIEVARHPAVSPIRLEHVGHKVEARAVRAVCLIGHGEPRHDLALVEAGCQRLHRARSRKHVEQLVHGAVVPIGLPHPQSPRLSRVAEVGGVQPRVGNAAVERRVFQVHHRSHHGKGAVGHLPPVQGPIGLEDIADHGLGHDKGHAPIQTPAHRLGIRRRLQHLPGLSVDRGLFGEAGVTGLDHGLQGEGPVIGQGSRVRISSTSVRALGSGRIASRVRALGPIPARHRIVRKHSHHAHIARIDRAAGHLRQRPQKRGQRSGRHEQHDGQGQRH